MEAAKPISPSIMSYGSTSIAIHLTDRVFSCTIYNPYLGCHSQ